MDRAFVNAIDLRPPVVLGLQLKPLALGHVMVLYAIDSPFFAEGRLDVFALSAAVYVCSNQASAFFGKGLTPPDRKTIQKWARACGSAKMDYAAETKRFVKYIEAYLEHPENWTDDGGKKPRAPWPFTIAFALINQAHFTEPAALDEPVNRAMCWYACLGEVNGNEIVTDAENAELEKQTAGG